MTKVIPILWKITYLLSNNPTNRMTEETVAAAQPCAARIEVQVATDEDIALDEGLRPHEAEAAHKVDRTIAATARSRNEQCL